MSINQEIAKAKWVGSDTKREHQVLISHGDTELSTAQNQNTFVKTLEPSCKATAPGRIKTRRKLYQNM